MIECVLRFLELFYYIAKIVIEYIFIDLKRDGLEEILTSFLLRITFASDKVRKWQLIRLENGI